MHPLIAAAAQKLSILQMPVGCPQPTKNDDLELQSVQLLHPLQMKTSVAITLQWELQKLKEIHGKCEKIHLL